MNYSKLEQLDEDEQILIKWQYGLFGDFYSALMLAIEKADQSNLDKLAHAFPAHVTALKRYRSEAGWWDTVVKRANLHGVFK